MMPQWLVPICAVLIILSICIIRWYVHKTLRTVMRMDTLFSTGRSSGSSVLPIYVLLPNHPHPPLNRGHAGSSHIFSSDPFHWPRTLPPAVGLMVSQQGWVVRIPWPTLGQFIHWFGTWSVPLFPCRIRFRAGVPTENS